MNFSNDYFEDEVRDGFYVASVIKRIWAAQLEVLEDIDKVCKKHHIRYFAEWGTLLGAVRHKGFIPWDDDLDIGMLRDDYEKFKKVAQRELPAIYGVLNFENMQYDDETHDYMTRVYSGRQIRMDEEYLNKFHGSPFVVGVDIFPLDYLSGDEKDIEYYKEQLILLSTTASIINTLDAREKENHLHMIEKIYHVKIDRDKSIQQQLYLLADRMCGMFKKKDAKYVTLAAHLTECDYKLPKSCYENVVYIPFETIEIPVPIGYDTVLSAKYGDYMTPVRAGGGHDYPFFKSQIELCDSREFKLYDRYVFRRRDLERTHETDHSSLKKKSGNILQLLGEAQNEMYTLAEEGNWDSVLTLLADCQDTAVALGEKIECVKGCETTSVVQLEKYCEKLYIYYEHITTYGNCPVPELRETLDECLSHIQSSITKEVVNKREIVFLPFKKSYWKSMENIWRIASQDSDCDVYVVPIPYYSKRTDGSLGEMHYDGDEYPDDIAIWDYRSFDFGLHCPDTIVMQEPHDEYNAAISVPQFFYSGNLRELTDDLVYLPYFMLDEIEDTDERGKVSLEYFCTVPGVVKADTVVVQSEKMKKVFIEALTEFAGEKTSKIWNEKIIVMDRSGEKLYDCIRGKWTE